MRHLGTIATVAVIAYWALMNVLLVRREAESDRLGGYQRGVSAFLGASLERERWMSVYRKAGLAREKIGYSGLRIEKVHDEEGIRYLADLESRFRGTLPGQSFFRQLTTAPSSLKVEGQLVLDERMEPLRLRLDLGLSLLEDTPMGSRQSFQIHGERRGDRLQVELEHGEKTVGVTIPAESLALSDGLAPALPVAGYRVGETYRVRVFHPLAPLGLGDEMATVRVLSERTERVDGPLVDVLEVETEWRGTKISSLVTRDGELIRQEIGPPLELILEREPSRFRATRGFER